MISYLLPLCIRWVWMRCRYSCMNYRLRKPAFSIRQLRIAVSKTKRGKEKIRFDKNELKKALQIFEYIKPYRGYFIASLILVFVSTFSFYAIFYFIGLLIDIAQGQSKFGLTLKHIAYILLGVLIIQGIVSYLRVVFTARVSEYAISDIRTEVFHKLVTLPITFFEENQSGELISRVSADVSKLYNVFSITLIEFFRQVITLIVGIGFLLYMTPRLSVIMLLTFPVVVLLAMFFGRYIRKFSKQRQELLAESNRIIGDAVQGIQIVKAYTNEDLEIKRYKHSMSELVSIAMDYAKARAWFSFFILTIFFGAICFIIYMGASMLQSGSMTAGELLSFVTVTSMIGASIAGLGNFTTELFGAIGATDRIKDILTQSPEVDVSINSQVHKGKADLSFIDVGFSYPSRPESKILNHINIKAKTGETVALVGPSGVGKSTIAQLILRFYKIDSGDILLNGKSIYDMELRGYRRRISFVPQEIILFSGTIADNIRYGDTTASAAQIAVAAEKANCAEFIEKFTEGMDTLVGEKGIKLSGGQRQRLAIARALLRNPDIFILDEATSALDSASEKLVQDALDNVMKERTCIVIAHRLSTIVDADRIYVLQDEGIAEYGTHSELMTKKGIYFNQASLGRLFD